MNIVDGCLDLLARFAVPLLIFVPIATVALILRACAS